MQKELKKGKLQHKDELISQTKKERNYKINILNGLKPEFGKRVSYLIHLSRSIISIKLIKMLRILKMSEIMVSIAC